jgi:hypothetical protein
MHAESDSTSHHTHPQQLQQHCSLLCCLSHHPTSSSELQACGLSLQLLQQPPSTVSSFTPISSSLLPHDHLAWLLRKWQQQQHP